VASAIEKRVARVEQSVGGPGEPPVAVIQVADNISCKGRKFDNLAAAMAFAKANGRGAEVIHLDVKVVDGSKPSI